MFLNCFFYFLKIKNCFKKQILHARFFYFFSHVLHQRVCNECLCSKGIGSPTRQTTIVAYGESINSTCFSWGLWYNASNGWQVLMPWKFSHWSKANESIKDVLNLKDLLESLCTWYNLILDRYSYYHLQSLTFLVDQDRVMGSYIL